MRLLKPWSPCVRRLIKTWSSESINKPELNCLSFFKRSPGWDHASVSNLECLGDANIFWEWHVSQTNRKTMRSDEAWKSPTGWGVIQCTEATHTYTQDSNACVQMCTHDCTDTCVPALKLASGRIHALKEMKRVSHSFLFFQWTLLLSYIEAIRVSRAGLHLNHATSDIPIWSLSSSFNFVFCTPAAHPIFFLLFLPLLSTDRRVLEGFFLHRCYGVLPTEPSPQQAEESSQRSIHTNLSSSHHCCFWANIIIRTCMPVSHMP